MLVRCWGLEKSAEESLWCDDDDDEQISPLSQLCVEGEREAVSI